MNIFSKVKPIKVGRSVFNLSYEKKMTVDMGYLYPSMCDEVVPGDIFKIANEIVIRFNPMVAPILHEVKARIDYFFVPYRLLWSDWEKFITGDVLGNDASVLPRWEVSVPRIVGSLWDYLGFPTGISLTGLDAPISFPRDAYNFIYNEYYRDENLINKFALTDDTIKARAWTKDYFTSALPFQQRGTAPALPISGTTHAVWATGNFANAADGDNVTIDSVTNVLNVNAAGGDTRLRAVFNNNTVDLSAATTFNSSDIRLAMQIQRWMERNARAGVRYTEFLRAHFGVAPSDERLQRPEYIGGFKAPIIFSEVLQTSETATTPQGHLAGHGIAAERQFVSKYHVQEFGLIMGILSIMPTPAYQQGINRQWLRRSRYDFYSPEFANLSEQGIELEELYAQDTSVGHNRNIFGYQGRYSEMRYKGNMVCGLMKTTYNYWHLGRIFGAEPALNSTFVNGSDVTKRVFAVQDVPELIVNVANKIIAIRPMPFEPEPGLLDHV